MTDNRTPMKMMTSSSGYRSGLLLLLLLLAGCGASVPEEWQPVGRPVSIVPDNRDATLPPNIAPLNFRVAEQADDYVVRFWAGREGHQEEIVSRGAVTDVDIADWHHLLSLAQGDTLYTDVFVRNGDRWIRFPELKNPVSADTIDRYLTYRLIPPSYVDYEGMTLCQRDVSNFSERVVYDNMMFSEGDNGQCINCHVPQNQNRTGHSLFHVRQYKGGTMLIDGRHLTKVNLKTDSTLSAGVYPAWHPQKNNLIAFSVNETGQVFHTRDVQKIEVLDFASDLILYDADANKVYDIDCRPDEFETFPAWSPDGQWLYYASAHFEQQTDNIDAELDDGYQQLKYNLYRRPFDAQTLKFGPRELVFDAASMGKSASTPRVSPDGCSLLFALADYGQFHIWHASARLWTMPLSPSPSPAPSGEARPALDETWGPGSYHSFSSTGRWVVFSSRRTDGSYTRLYMAHVSPDGSLSVPFLLPQRSPFHDEQLFRSYNVPELLVRPVAPSLRDITQAVNESPLQAVYAGSALLAPDERRAVPPSPQPAGQQRLSTAVAY